MVEDLLPCWRAELAEAGYPPARLAATVERAGRDYVPPGADIVDQLADELLGPSGRLATEKTFDLPEAVVAVAPLLAGLPVSMLDTALHKVLSDERGRGPAAGSCRCPGAGVGRPPACWRTRAPRKPTWPTSWSPAERRASRPRSQPMRSWAAERGAEAPVSTRERPKWPRSYSLPGTRLTS